MPYFYSDYYLVLASHYMLKDTAIKNEIFNENLPAKISKTNAEFVYKFLLAEIAAQRGELNQAGHIYLDLAKLTKSIPSGRTCN